MTLVGGRNIKTRFIKDGTLKLGSQRQLLPRGTRKLPTPKLGDRARWMPFAHHTVGVIKESFDKKLEVNQSHLRNAADPFSWTHPFRIIRRKPRKTCVGLGDVWNAPVTSF